MTAPTPPIVFADALTSVALGNGMIRLNLSANEPNAPTPAGDAPAPQQPVLQVVMPLPALAPLHALLGSVVESLLAQGILRREGPAQDRPAPSAAAPNGDGRDAGA